MKAESEHQLTLLESEAGNRLSSALSAADIDKQRLTTELAAANAEIERRAHLADAQTQVLTFALSCALPCVCVWGFFQLHAYSAIFTTTLCCSRAQLLKTRALVYVSLHEFSCNGTDLAKIQLHVTHLFHKGNCKTF